MIKSTFYKIIKKKKSESFNFRLATCVLFFLFGNCLIVKTTATMMQ